MYKYIYIFFFFHHITCESTCDTLPSSATNQVLVAQGGTATPDATKQLLPPDRVWKKKKNIYIYIYIYAKSTKRRNYIMCSSSFLCSLWFLKSIYFWLLMSLCTCSNCFLMLHNHTGMLILHAFHTCWSLFALDQIQLGAYCTVVWRQYEATFNLQPVIPIFERNEMTEWPRNHDNQLQ